jgi:hypothetical protein
MARKCKVCRSPATMTVGVYSVCSYDCGVALARRNQERKAAKEKKAERVKAKADRERIKTRSDWLKDCQRAFNAMIRARDAGKPCVSCGRPDDGLHQRHAGHYRSVGGHPALRFEPLNTASQCATCNNYLSGNLVQYRAELIRRIGLESVEWLEGPHEPKKYTAEDLKRMAAEFRAQARLYRSSAQ